MPSNTATRLFHVDVDGTLTVPPEHEARANRCLEAYDVGCIVDHRIRAGVEYTPTTSLETAD